MLKFRIILFYKDGKVYTIEEYNVTSNTSVGKYINRMLDVVRLNPELSREFRIVNISED
jgi:hypothetical protein